MALQHRSIALLAAAVSATLGAASARAAYPTAPQISDRSASASFTLMLSDVATVPHSNNQSQSSQTAAQVARINFLRAEPVPSLASQRLFAPDLNANLYIYNRSSHTFSTYINFPSVFPNNGTQGFDNSPGFAAGLVTVQFDPNYANNGKFYTVHTELDGVTTSGFRQAVLTEWQDTNISDSTFQGTHHEIFRVQYTGNIHPMGDIAFNPLATDSSNPDWRNMYIASGDGSAGESSGTTRNKPQRLDDFRGKILRIRTSDSGTPGTYSIPSDNPFLNQTLYPGARGEVYADGLRNPHRLSWDVDPANPSNNHLFVDNIGLHNYEEINIVHPGANYGYSRIEGNQVLGTNNQVNNNALPGTLPVLTTLDTANTTPGAVQSVAPTYPVAQYSHQDGDAISSGFVYRGNKMPQLKGKYVFGDISTGRLFYVDLNDLLAVNDAQPNPVAMSNIHEMDIFYSSPFDSQGLRERRVFDLVRDEYDARNETPIGSIDHVGGVVDGDGLPGQADTTDGNDPYGVPYGSGRADIRLALIDNELYLLSKSDGMVRALTQALPGDSNLDGIVDVTDLGALATSWQTAGMWKNGDFNHDNFVDVTDLGILATNWQQTATGQSLAEALAAVGLSGANVPEPTSMTIVVGALCGLVTRRRR